MQHPGHQWLMLVCAASLTITAHTRLPSATTSAVACVVVSVPGQLAGQPGSPGHTAKQLVLYELVACLNLVWFQARLLLNSFIIWTQE